MHARVNNRKGHGLKEEVESSQSSRINCQNNKRTEEVEKPVFLRDQLSEKDKLIDDVKRRLKEKELEFDKLKTNGEDLKARVHDLKGKLREK